MTEGNVFCSQINNRAHKYRGRYSPIGFDPGNFQLKLVQLAVEKNRLCCHRRISCPTPPGLFNQGKLNNPEKLSTILRQLRNETNWRNNTINLCLGPQSFNLARVKLPIMNKRDLARTMSLEVETRFSMIPRDTVFSYCPLFEEANINKTNKLKEYILVAADKSVSASFVNAVKLAGFKIGIIEVSPLSLLRFPEKPGVGNSPDASSCSLLIDIGHSDSSFIIYNSNSFSYYRNLRSGVSGFGKTGNRSVRTNSNILDTRFLAGVEQSLEYWLEQSENDRLYPEKLYLCGGGIYTPGLAAAIGERLGLRPRLYNPVAALCSNTDTNSQRTVMENTLFASSYGLALRGWVS